jgi:hypothetical protein
MSLDTTNYANAAGVSGASVRRICQVKKQSRLVADAQ